MTCVERIVPVSVTVPHGPHHISQVSSIRVDRATGLESVSNVQTDKEKAPTAENIVAAWIMSQETSPHLELHERELASTCKCTALLLCYFKKPFHVTSFNPSLLKLLSQISGFSP